MKKLFCLISCLLLVLLAAGQTTAIPDPNFEQELIDQGIDSMGVLDGFVLTADITTVETLVIAGTFKPSIGKISDLNGIEAFTALRVLHCDGNLISSLDLSSNLLLEELQCQQNILTSLDLSNNTLLELLYCNNNALTALNVLNNINMLSLRCQNNQLHYINIKNSPALSELRCNSNNLIFPIDLSQNPVLTTFSSTSNPDLPCIQVADTAAADAGSGIYATWSKPMTATYSENCFSNDFITTWKTDNLGSTYPNEINIPAGIGVFEYAVDWGDGTASINLTGSETHTYPAPGIYTVSIIGTFPHIDFFNGTDRQKLLSIEQWGSQQWASMELSYIECINLQDNAADTPDLSQATSMFATFAYAAQFNSDISDWDVSTITNMGSLFQDATSFNQSLAAWDVSAVTDMNWMFGNFAATASDFDQDLGDWDISNVTNMTGMFNNAAMSIANYDSTLIGWNTLDIGETQIPSAMPFDGGNNQYCNGEMARANLLSTYGWTITDSGLNCAVVAAKVMLQGAALNPYTGEESLMRDDLRTAGLIPTTSPYTDAALVATSVFNTGGTSGTGLAQDDIVDWIWLELRDATINTSIIASQSALVQRDGDIVDLDGLSPINFFIGGGDYYLSLHHRNHLGVMTGTTVNLSSAIPTVDFTQAVAPISFGLNAQTTFGMPAGLLGIFAGNANSDTQMNYQGANNDTNTIKDNVIADAGAPNNLHSYTAYDTADVDMDGTVKYQGADNDSNRIKDIILSHPDNTGGSNLFTVTEQLPEN